MYNQMDGLVQEKKLAFVKHTARQKQGFEFKVL